ncbi:MAG TPA: hypothetical protein PKC21_04915 [Oligoflexia bacterium]|nr:hypothetical protein [Oligoflexia bacterium]HMR24677.1 hypothetical protein [Oligoflexia bacterium]
MDATSKSCYFLLFLIFILTSSFANSNIKVSDKEVSDALEQVQKLVNKSKAMFQANYLKCLPDIRVSCFKTSCKREELSKNESLKYSAVIKKGKEDDHYSWVSRDDTLMVRSNAGVYSIFFGVPGFLKVNSDGEYIEVMHTGVNSIQYFGKCAFIK